MRVRLWLIALVCVACGVISRIVFADYAPPNSRADAWSEWEFQVMWYTVALLLALLHVGRLGRSDRSTQKNQGCGAALLLILAYLVVVWISVPRD
jgi:hypothetical protein